MKKTRSLVAALAIIGFGQTAFAGSLDPIVEPTVIYDDAADSSAGTTLVLALALLLAMPLLTD